MPETAEMQDATTQAQKSQPTGTPPTAGAGGGQVQSPTGATTATAASAGTAAASAGAADSGMIPQPAGTDRADRISGRSHREPLGFGNPFAMMRAFSEEMDRLFESFGFRGGSRSGTPGAALESRSGSLAGEPLWSPQIEVSRRGNDLVVCADLPGMKREDLQVEFREDHLVLHGERRREHQSEEGGFYRTERSYGRFHRAIPLPEGVDAEQAQASFRDGVLEIRVPLPQRHEPRTRRIEIR